MLNAKIFLLYFNITMTLPLQYCQVPPPLVTANHLFSLLKKCKSFLPHPLIKAPFQTPPPLCLLDTCGEPESEN